MNIPFRKVAVPVLALLIAQPSSGGELLGYGEAVELAANASPGVVAQKASLDAARASERSAGRLPDPRLVLGIDNLPIDGPDQFSVDADFMTMRSLGVMQDVPNRARRRAMTGIAEATTERESAMLVAEALAKRGAAAEAWLAVHFAQDRVTLVSRLAADYEVLEDAMRGRLAAGSDAADAVLAIRQEALALADQRDVLTASAQSARARLDSLTGDYSGRPLLDDIPEIAVDPVRLRHAIASHAGIAPLTAEKAIVESELAEAEASGKGDWSWQLSYSKRGSQYGDMVSAEVSMDLPLWQSTRQGPTIKAKKLAVEQIDARREEAVRRHRAEIEADLAGVEALDRQLVRLRTQAVPLAEQRVELAQSKYRSGRGSLADLFAARRDLLMQQLRAIDLLEQSLSTKARLSYLAVEETP